MKELCDVWLEFALQLGEKQLVLTFSRFFLFKILWKMISTVTFRAYNKFQLDFWIKPTTDELCKDHKFLFLSWIIWKHFCVLHSTNKRSQSTLEASVWYFSPRVIKRRHLIPEHWRCVWCINAARCWFLGIFNQSRSSLLFQKQSTAIKQPQTTTKTKQPSTVCPGTSLHILTIIPLSTSTLQWLTGPHNTASAEPECLL